MPVVFSRSHRCSRGMSLLEVLVGIGLAGLLGLGIAGIYVESHRTDLGTSELVRLHENGQMAVSLLTREFKMMHFMGGVDAGHLSIAMNLEGAGCLERWALDPGRRVEFLEGEDLPALRSRAVALRQDAADLAACLSLPGLLPGSDVLAIKRTADTPARFAGSAGNTGINKPVDPGRVYLQVLDGLPVNNAGQNGVLLKGSDVMMPGAGSTSVHEMALWPYQARVFYVRDMPDLDGTARPALAMLSLEGARMGETLLVPGVEMLHLEFGVPDDSSGGRPVRFYSRPDARQLESATVARVYLLLRSLQPVRNYVDTATYRLGSLPPVRPGGPYLRKVFSTTVKLRNSPHVSVGEEN